MGHTARRRKLFSVVKKSFGYDVRCNVCGWVSNAWDYRRNALWRGWEHITEEHPD